MVVQQETRKMQTSPGLLIRYEQLDFSVITSHTVNTQTHLFERFLLRPLVTVRYSQLLMSLRKTAPNPEDILQMNQHQDNQLKNVCLQ